MIYSLSIIAAGVVATLLTRFLPFLFFSSKTNEPEWLRFLGKVLPYATMGLLVVFVLKDISFFETPFGIPELISIGVIVLIHKVFHNSLFSIALGTLTYMVLVQTIFI